MKNLFKKYKGAIVEESLGDISILLKFKIVETIVTKDENPADRWHIHTVEADEDQLGELSKVIKPRGWYAHFWNSDMNIIAVFRDRIFTFNYEDKASWQPAIDYGISVGIPREQLDFLIK